MLTKGIVLMLVAGLTLGGVLSYLAYDYYSSDDIEFPLVLSDPSDDLIFITHQTWNGRGRPNGTAAGESDYSEYYNHVDFLNLTLSQTQSGFNISMEWAGDIIISEGVVYAITIELRNISYIVTYSEGNLICVSDTPERNIDWYDYYNVENSTLITEFHVSRSYMNLTLDIDIQPQDISYILAFSGIGENEYYMDFVEFEARPDEDEEMQIPSVFNEINIRVDTDFTRNNGVSRGIGTADDPFIIEDITVSGVFNLEQTSKFVEIKNVIITGNGYMGINGDNIKIINLSINTSPDFSTDPIYNYNVGLIISAGSNIKVYGVNILTKNLSTAITIGWAKDILISGANINGAYTGIDMFGPKNVTVEHSSISNTTYAAFDIQNSKDVIIRNSTISNNTGNSVFSTSTSNTVTLEHCDIIGNNQGLWIESPESIIVYSNFLGNYNCIRLASDSINISIQNNNFIGNQGHIAWQVAEVLIPEYQILGNYFDNPVIASYYPNQSDTIIQDAGPVS